MARLLVTPEEVRNKANQIEAQKNLMMNKMNEMNKQVQTLNEHWDSQSGKSYVTKYPTVSKNINNSLNTLMKHIGNLKDAAQQYETTEQTQQRQVGNLSTNNIF